MFVWRDAIGTLYLVATPIGNLEDITLRALRVLREVTLIAAEDTRHTRKLLNHYAIATATTAYHEHNKLARLPAMLDVLAGGDVALVSDAGTPGINDPGFELVQAAIEAGFPVTPIPGPSAPIAALVASGLPTAQWVYLGFLPSKSSERRRFLEAWRTLPATLVCFEAPHRLQAALRDMEAVLGNRRIAIARELTKLHEEWVRGTIDDAVHRFEEAAPRGEFTIVIAGYAPEAEQTETAMATDWRPEAERRLRVLRAEGVSGSTAARQVARELDVARGEVYRIWTNLAADDAG
ncbi:MAG TPA: 16S rRNA (cytidine(1402)-2'-O)-methyltransferase [Herpetosiphonaceae bacterium]|nr:16S rRNA (cytidine(1402)-2'-O)-methyltransferase [Herpetosiphonaceae bacterium]